MLDSLKILYELLLKLVKSPKNLVEYLESICDDENFDVLKDKLEWLDTYKDTNTLLVGHRGCGKTFTLCLYALWYAITNEHKNIGISSNNNSNTKDMLNIIDKFYKKLPEEFRKNIKYKKTKYQITINDNVRIIGRQSNDINFWKGRHIDLLILDEFAFWKKNVAEELAKSFFPVMFSSRSSRIIISSVPNGIDNVFYELYNNNNINIKKIFYALDEEKRKKYMMDWYLKFGKDFVDREYGCEFINNK